MLSRLEPFIGLVTILLFYGWLQKGHIQAAPYGYDEADYLRAAKLGPIANAWDTPSRSLGEFISIGLSSLTQRKDSRVNLSEIARAGNDVGFERHTHGPLYFYWLELSSHWAHDEGALRAWSQVFPVLGIVLIFLGCLWLIPGEEGVLAATLSASLFATSAAIIGTRDLSPHLAFVLCALGSTFCAAKARQTGSRRAWYGAMFAAGLAFAALEVALVLLLSLGLLAWLERNGPLRLTRNEVWKSIAVFAGTILLIWPAGLLKLAIVKAYLFFGYLALMRSSEWGHATFSHTWANRLLSSPAEWVTFFLALILWTTARVKRYKDPAIPFLILGGLMVIALLRVNTDNLRYAVPFLPALQVFSGLTLAQFIYKLAPRLRWSLSASALILMSLSAYRFVAEHPSEIDPYPSAVLNAVREQGLTNKKLLVPQNQVPILRYYFPEAAVKGFVEPPPAVPPGVDAILLPGQTRFSGGEQQMQ
jgi:hypothetical protein